VTRAVFFGGCFGFGIIKAPWGAPWLMVIGAINLRNISCRCLDVGRRGTSIFDGVRIN
jgi:hypothetical protein